MSLNCDVYVSILQNLNFLPLFICTVPQVCPSQLTADTTSKQWVKTALIHLHSIYLCMHAFIWHLLHRLLQKTHFLSIIFAFVPAWVVERFYSTGSSCYMKKELESISSIKCFSLRSRMYEWHIDLTLNVCSSDWSGGNRWLGQVLPLSRSSGRRLRGENTTSSELAFTMQAFGSNLLN